ncbi:sulfatase-like hydrolase/transferase [Falsihalocynthiibacter sp. SS001]|uniref:sulfatase-like hydrolase/transferase n=1 Tax=Falsihalocynthiibacter sp. SS001 TaxID=3349698 RepID=UPI0036D370D9
MSVQPQALADHNLLVIMADQFRADLLDGRLARYVPTPHIDELAEQSLVLGNHHTVALPCGPARASFLTGLYPHQHGAKRNGQALHLGIPNLATELRKIGREPLLFGYTDTQPNPEAMFANDPAHMSMSAPMEGFTEVVEMREEAWRWLAYLREQGYDVPDANTPEFNRLYRPKNGMLGGPALYDAEHSDTAFLTNETIKALDIRKAAPWSAFVTYIRPHPPFVAPAPYHEMIDPQALPQPLEPSMAHPFFDVERNYPSSKDMFWGYDGYSDGLSEDQIAKIRATYLGLVAELDHHIGRLISWLKSSGQYDKTIIMFTADHGEMLGDFGLWGKLAPFPQASHIPCTLRVPDMAPNRVSHLTQSIDIFAAILRLMGKGEHPEFSASQEARVEFELGNPSRPTRFEEAWNEPAERLGCTVRHTETSRVADFGGVVPPMHMDPQTGVIKAQSDA